MTVTSSDHDGIGSAARPDPGERTSPGDTPARVRMLRPLRRNGILVVLGLIVAIAALSSPQFLDPGNLQNVGRSVAIVGVIAIGQTLVAIVGGLGDLSVGPTVSLVAVLTLGLQPTLGPEAALVVGLLAGLLVGCLNGVLIGRFRTNSIVTTIGAGVVANGVALWFTGGDTMFGRSEGLHAFGTGSFLGIANIILVFGLVVIAGAVLLGATTMGHRMYATGGNLEAARASGIRVARVVATAFVLSAAAASIAGILFAALLDQVNYDSGSSTTFASIAAVAVGGTSLFGGEGSVLRTVVGVLLIGILNNVVVLVGLPLNAQMVVTGAIILVAVTLDAVTRRTRR